MSGRRAIHAVSQGRPSLEEIHEIDDIGSIDIAIPVGIGACKYGSVRRTNAAQGGNRAALEVVHEETNIQTIYTTVGIDIAGQVIAVSAADYQVDRDIILEVLKIVRKKLQEGPIVS
jgi:hypothetical protein